MNGDGVIDYDLLFGYFPQSKFSRVPCQGFVSVREMRAFDDDDDNGDGGDGHGDGDDDD